MARPTPASRPATLLVKAHPPATGIKVGGGDGGIGTATKSVETVAWRGINWPIAVDMFQNTLWVCCDPGVVDAHRPSLNRLARAIAGHNGNIREAVKAGSAPDSRTAKQIALDDVTDMVSEAIAAGATPADIRLAVFAAMGLDSDPT